MVFHVEWKSVQGSLTVDNRDYCGISERSDATLYMVADGATSSVKGGELAKALVHYVVDAFLSIDEVSEDGVCDLIERAQHDFRHCYSHDVASYLIIIKMQTDELIIIHAGDCRLGQLKECGGIDWITQPHTLANAIRELTEEELVSSQERHVLTRCFKGRCFIRPDVTTLLLDKESVFLIATDGFWADLSENKKLDFRSGVISKINLDGDDKSVLILSKTEADAGSAENITIVGAQRNLYSGLG